MKRQARCARFVFPKPTIFSISRTNRKAGPMPRPQELVSEASADAARQSLEALTAAITPAVAAATAAAPAPTAPHDGGRRPRRAAPDAQGLARRQSPVARRGDGGEGNQPDYRQAALGRPIFQQVTRDRQRRRAPKTARRCRRPAQRALGLVDPHRRPRSRSCRASARGSPSRPRGNRSSATTGRARAGSLHSGRPRRGFPLPPIIRAQLPLPAIHPARRTPRARRRNRAESRPAARRVPRPSHSASMMTTGSTRGKCSAPQLPQRRPQPPRNRSVGSPQTAQKRCRACQSTRLRAPP